jgi:UrcA family protein
MTRFVTTVRKSLFFAAAIVAATPALAQSTDESRHSVKVSYADLDLSSTAGQHQLHSRLIGAAREACEDSMQPGSMMTDSRNACMNHAMAQADVRFAALVTAAQPQVAMVGSTSGHSAR